MRHSLAEVCSKTEMRETDATATKPLEVVKNIVDAADDAKGKEIVILDVSKNFGLADYFIVASARSDRHTQGIANKVVEKLSELGLEPYSIQGMEDGQWVIVDCVEVVVHIFYEPLRHHYDLESLWLNAETIDPQKLKRTLRANSSKRDRSTARQREVALA